MGKGSSHRSSVPGAPQDPPQQPPRCLVVSPWVPSRCTPCQGAPPQASCSAQGVQGEEQKIPQVKRGCPLVPLSPSSINSPPVPPTHHSSDVPNRPSPGSPLGSRAACSVPPAPLRWENDSKKMSPSTGAAQGPAVGMLRGVVPSVCPPAKQWDGHTDSPSRAGAARQGASARIWVGFYTSSSCQQHRALHSIPQNQTATAPASLHRPWKSRPRGGCQDLGCAKPPVHTCVL